MSTPSSAPFTAPMMPPMIAPMPAPAADPRCLALDPFALERLCDGATHRVIPAANRELVERDGQAAFSISSTCFVHRTDYTAQDRTRRNQHVVATIEIGNGRRFEPLFNLRRVGRQFSLQADVELLPCRYGAVARAGTCALRPLVAHDAAGHPAGRAAST